MRTFAFVVLIAGLASIALAADKVENPDYKAWAALKVGAVVKWHSSTTDKMNKETDLIRTLKEVTPEKVVLDSVFLPNNFQQSVPVPATIDPATTQPAQPASKPGTTVTITEGDETLKAAGRSFQCHWIATTEKSATRTSVITKWKCPEVPDLVKFEMKDGTNHTTRVLTEFKAGR